MANKKPWFKFYPSDFLTGTIDLSPAEVCVYIKLICRMYEREGEIERDDLRLAKLCGMRPQSFVKHLTALIAQGKIIENEGRLSNERVITETKKWQKSGLIQSQNARKRWSKSQEKSEENQSPSDAKASKTSMPNGCQNDAYARVSEARKKDSEYVSDSETHSSPPESGSTSLSASSLRSEPDRSKSVADGERNFTKLLPPGGNWSKLVWDVGLPWLAQKVGKQPSTIRSLVGKWQADLGKDGEALWEIFIAAQQHDPSDATAWIAGAVKDRKRRAEAGDDVKIIGLDMEIIDWRAAFKAFRKHGGWPRKWGPRPDEDGCLAPQKVLNENGYQSGPTEWDRWYAHDIEKGVERAKDWH